MEKNTQQDLFLSFLKKPGLKNKIIKIYYLIIVPIKMK